MTLPGAETMKGGIIGDDCFRSSGGVPFVVGVTVRGISKANCAGDVSVYECLDIWAACDEMIRD